MVLRPNMRFEGCFFFRNVFFAIFLVAIGGQLKPRPPLTARPISRNSRAISPEQLVSNGVTLRTGVTATPTCYVPNNSTMRSSQLAWPTHQSVFVYRG